MNFRIVSYLLGRLALGFAGVFFVPLFLAICLGESWYEFFIAAVFAAILGVIFCSFGNFEKSQLTMREGIAVTGLGWIISSFIGAVPYFSSGALGILDGWVESVSGFSGTGATVIESLSSMPESLLLWRALTHWLGGLGIIVIFIALLPQFGHGAIYMFEAESTGPFSERFLPRVKSMAKSLFCVYLAFTVLASAAFITAGMSPLEGIDHAMATIATGGFSTNDSSVAGFHSSAIEYVAIFFMMLSSANFGMYVTMIRHGIKPVKQNTEYMAYILIVLLCTFFISSDIVLEMKSPVADAVRAALFQSASVSSTTGFVSEDFDVWPPFSKLCIFFLIAVGGTAGSTSGGIKVSRVILMIKSAALLVRQHLSPKSRISVSLGGRSMDEMVLYGTLQFLFVYIFLVALWTALFILDGGAPFDSAALAVTTMSNVGPAFGKWGATATYASLPAFSKCVACVSMLTGRLEIFTFMTMLRPSFWRGGVW